MTQESAIVGNFNKSNKYDCKRVQLYENATTREHDA